MSLQLRYVYTRDGHAVYGKWYWLENGEYYYPAPEMSGWSFAVQVRETDGCPPPRPRKPNDPNRRWRQKEKRRAAREALADASRV